eukprot:gene57444-biopygen28357
MPCISDDAANTDLLSTITAHGAATLGSTNHISSSILGTACPGGAKAHCASWLGLTRAAVRPGVFLWQADCITAQTEYTNWAPGQPRGDRNCVESWAGTDQHEPGQWKDKFCTELDGFLAGGPGAEWFCGRNSGMDGVGCWINIDFGAACEVRSLKFKQRWEERTRSATIRFSDGTSQDWGVAMVLKKLNIGVVVRLPSPQQSPQPVQHQALRLFVRLQIHAADVTTVARSLVPGKNPA